MRTNPKILGWCDHGLAFHEVAHYKSFVVQVRRNPFRNSPAWLAPVIGKSPVKVFRNPARKCRAFTYLGGHVQGQQQTRAQRPDSGRRVTWHRPCMCPVAVLALLYVESANSARYPLVALKTLLESVYPLSNKKADFPPFSRAALSLPLFGRFQGVQGCNPHGHWVCAETLAFFVRCQGFQHGSRSTCNSIGMVMSGAFRPYASIPRWAEARQLHHP